MGYFGGIFGGKTSPRVWLEWRRFFLVPRFSVNILSSRPKYSTFMHVFWHVCSHARRVSYDTTKMKKRFTEFHLWPSECRARPQTVPLTAMLTSSGSQIFFIFPPTFVNRSPALILYHFHTRIAKCVEQYLLPLPEQRLCAFSFSCFR